MEVLDTTLKTYRLGKGRGGSVIALPAWLNDKLGIRGKESVNVHYESTDTGWKLILRGNK